jgi:hypothetical protein
MGLGLWVSAPGVRADPDDASRQFLPVPTQTASTIPSNGDVNPYGVAFVPPGFPGGTVQPGEILVSNFNNFENLQGTGTTIVALTPQGARSLFFHSTALGLTEALVALTSGFVVVGNLPTADGTSATAQPGSLQVLDAHGTLVTTLTDLIDGPWGMTADDGGELVHLFVSNVLSGTVIRIEASTKGGTFTVHDTITLASGLDHRGDPAALELGPAGLSYDAVHDVLYFVSSTDNAIYAIGDAEHHPAPVALIDRDLIHFHGPVGLTLAPNGHFIVGNSDGSNADPNQPSELVEVTVGGKFISQLSLDPNNGGAFGFAIGPSPLSDDFLLLAAVDDNANTIELITQPAPCGF